MSESLIAATTNPPTEIVAAKDQIIKWSIREVSCSNIENGTIASGNASSNLTGNTSDNALTGNDSNNALSSLTGCDVLLGGAGDDTLVGGVGSETFQLDKSQSVDKITDFNVLDDSIQLDDALFTQLTPGVLNVANFIKGSSFADLNDYALYNPSTGAVVYDADDAGVGIQIATLGLNSALTNAVFW